MLVMLGFGSSARRGATGWTDRARVRWVLETARPDLVVDGTSPAGGADDIVHEEAVAAGIRAERCHVDTKLDGPWPRAGIRRNERMFATHGPGLAAGFVSGKVGEPLSSGSAHMAGVCLRGLEHVPPCAVVVYREDGVEPYRGLDVAIGQLGRLYVATKDEALVVPGRALRALLEGKTPRDEVLSALAFAREGSRWAPWVEAVEATVRRST